MAGIGVTSRGLMHIYRVEGYDIVALAGVDLDVVPGESLALLGPSGSGKSTLLSILAGLLKPSAGKVMVGEHDLAKATPAELQRMRADDVGVVLQGSERNLLPYLTPIENVAYAQRAVDRRSRRGLASPRELLDLVGLDSLDGRARLADLSPGVRQRIALAVGVANGPGLLLADEPTSQLDTESRADVLGALAAVNAAHGTTVVVVTHDAEVGGWMGRTVTMRDGRVGAEGRRGEDFSVVGRDGSLHLPPELLEVVGPGTLLRVVPESDGSIRLVPDAAG